jgi:pyrroloquinoline-quinone synthase
MERVFVGLEIRLLRRVLIRPMESGDDAKVRLEILNNLIEEETGKMSGRAPHPELYIRLGEALGSTRQRMLNIRALPESVALRTWWIWLVANRPFVEGLASVSIAGEGRPGSWR